MVSWDCHWFANCLSEHTQLSKGLPAGCFWFFWVYLNAAAALAPQRPLRSMWAGLNMRAGKTLLAWVEKHRI